MKLYFDDEGLDGQLQRTVGKCDSGMANVGECLYIASRIEPRDRQSWYAEWTTFADGLVAQATSAERGGHDVSAASLRLRASEYYRQAFFWHRDDLGGKELTTACQASVDAFRRALPGLPRAGRVIDGDTPGYLFVPPGRGPFKTILHIGGYDNTAEELYASAYPALDRGWAFICLDGPGQGSVLYERRVPQRPDWEHVVPGMFALAAALPEVDADRIALVGRSFGGLLAPRGAAGVPRLAALIVDPGQYDMAAGVAARLGELWRRVDDPAAKPEFDALLEIPALRTLLGPRMATHGVADPQAYFQDMCRYTNAELAPTITCPSFVTDNETDPVSTGQGRHLFDAMTCPKEFRRFTRAEGAEGHCEGLAPIVFWTAAFDWLDVTVR
ncbi:alpha/beta hydrolase family protein [Variovorax sp. J22P168]|uniref:alpha/beta hydrolase family protein n=1 Tax=Variovorax jilinensis TaxID=3053513 RepID=UPI002578BCE5|nr:alpha/beta hydrolase family protein [Variovorax sp. J22P168]MDM0015576.1 alpha/beta hydrolase family protein [Variovorax sp. J22P168]